MGIFFGSNSASDDKLDDYDEGSFTPTFTVGGSDSGVTYASNHREGYYVKIGSLIYVKGMMSLSSRVCRILKMILDTRIIRVLRNQSGFVFGTDDSDPPLLSWEIQHYTGRDPK